MFSGATACYDVLDNVFEAHLNFAINMDSAEFPLAMRFAINSNGLKLHCHGSIL